MTKNTSRTSSLLVVFGLLTGGTIAASFEKPKPKIVSSPSAVIIARIDPGMSDEKNDKEKKATCVLSQYDQATQQYRFLRKIKLVNPILPLVAILPDDGSYLLTVDDYYDNENAVVLYGAKGELIKQWDLSELYSENELALLPRFGPQIIWHGSVVILSKDPLKVLIAPPDTQTESMPNKRFIVDVQAARITSEPSDEPHKPTKARLRPND